jgi:hypothetical protein
MMYAFTKCNAVYLRALIPLRKHMDASNDVGFGKRLPGSRTSSPTTAVFRLCGSITTLLACLRCQTLRFIALLVPSAA